MKKKLSYMNLKGMAMKTVSNNPEESPEEAKRAAKKMRQRTKGGKY